MSLTFLTFVPLLLLICWLVAEFRGRIWIRAVTGLAALIAIAVMAFLWGGFMEAFKHTEFPVPHDSPADTAFMDAAGTNGISMRINGTNVTIRPNTALEPTATAPSVSTNK